MSCSPAGLFASQSAPRSYVCVAVSLGSRNGTLVNGRPVAKHFLRDRDQVDIGRQLIVYLADDGARAEPPPAIT